MDVPLSQGFAPSYRKCEEFIGNAIIAVADESQDEACVESAKMARGRAADFASRDAPLPIGDTVMFEGRELTNTVVGFDGGWQRRAIGMGSYNSRSGHAFMVCQLTGKVLVREVKRIFFARVSRKLGYELGVNSRNGLDALTKKAAYDKRYQSSLKAKSRRKRKEYTSLPEAVAQRSRPVGNYSSGSSVAAENAHAARAAGASASAPAPRAEPSACGACGKTDHKRRSSQLCGMFMPRNKRAKPAEPVERVV